MNCREFFEANSDDLQYCKTLQQHSETTQISWEGQSASQHSCSPVGDNELLARQVVDPTHFDKVTGTIKPTFFEDASSKGASCHRLTCINIEDVQKITEARVTLANQNPPPTGLREAIGFTLISACEVRSIRTSGAESRRGAAVYDTAKKDDSSHADICQLVSGKKEGKSVRAQLFLLTKDRLKRF